MDEEFLTIFRLSDELLRTFDYHDHPQCAMNGAEIMMVAIVAA